MPLGAAAVQPLKTTELLKCGEVLIYLHICEAAWLQSSWSWAVEQNSLTLQASWIHSWHRFAAWHSLIQLLNILEDFIYSGLWSKRPLQLHFLLVPRASPSCDLSHSEPLQWTIVPLSGAPDHSAACSWSAVRPFQPRAVPTAERSPRSLGDFCKCWRNHRCDGWVWPGGNVRDQGSELFMDINIYAHTVYESSGLNRCLVLDRAGRASGKPWTIFIKMRNQRIKPVTENPPVQSNVKKIQSNMALHKIMKTYYKLSLWLA